MNNFEKIKAMSIDEMAEWLKEGWFCDYCTTGCCQQDECKNGVKQWLEQEAEEWTKQTA